MAAFKKRIKWLGIMLFRWHPLWLPFFFSFLSFLFGLALDQQQDASLAMGLRGGLDLFYNSVCRDRSYEIPRYGGFTLHPSFSARSYNDLIGNIQIYEADGLEKLERLYFYMSLDYYVNFIATHYVIDSGELLVSYEHGLLIHRTMLQYRDMPWHSLNVRSIHGAFDTLNDEMIKLLCEYYTIEKFRTKEITIKDANLVILKHCAYAHAVGLEPVDFNWGRFTAGGLEEYSFGHPMDKEFIDRIKNEMFMEFRFLDLDLALAYLERKIETNNAIYNYFMRQKLILEKIDWEIAGKGRPLSYEDNVHYRTSGGMDIVYRYATVRGEINMALLQRYVITLNRTIEDYRWSFDASKFDDYYDAVQERADREIQERLIAYRDRFFFK